MADTTGYVAVVSEEDKAQHFIVAIVTKEVNRTTQLKDLTMYPRT